MTIQNQILVTSLMATVLVSNAFAQTNEMLTHSAFSLRQWAEQDYMLGNWGGLRTNLSNRGIDFEFFYAGSMPVNLSGGIRQGSVYQGGFLMGMDLNSDKLLGYKGGTFHVSSIGLHGDKPFSDRYIGDLNKVNLLDYANAMRLWELWYQQTFLNDQLALKLGVLSIDRDFIVPELYGGLGQAPFINQTFFFPTMAFNLFDIPGMPTKYHGLATTPTSAPGALLKWSPSKSFYTQAGIYGGNPDKSFSGTHFRLSESEGSLSFFELGYRLNSSSDSTGLEGSYKIGGYYHTADFVDVYDGVTATFMGLAGLPVPPIREYDGNGGAYLLAEQQLYREKDRTDPARQGLLTFFRLAGAPANRNLAQFAIDGGLVYKGLLPGRNWDTLAAAVSYMRISDDIRQAQLDANTIAPNSFVPVDYETVFELSYKIQATAWWTVQPSFQYVFHPGGSRAIPDAKALIVQMTLRF